MSGTTPTPRSSPDFVPALRFNFLTPLFDLVVRATMREAQFKRALVSQAAIGSGQRVLDLGCGTGTLAILAKESAPDTEVVGLDGDPRILDLARAKAEAAGAEVHFEHGYSTELPYETGSFDLVLSTLFFHHLSTDDKRETFAEVKRVLRPGGQLHIADFTKPGDPLMALGFAVVRLVDGFERTGVNARGELGALASATGFEGVAERSRFRTALGRIALLRAMKGV